MSFFVFFKCSGVVRFCVRKVNPWRPGAARYHSCNELPGTVPKRGTALKAFTPGVKACRSTHLPPDLWCTSSRRRYYNLIRYSIIFQPPPPRLQLFFNLFSSHSWKLAHWNERPLRFLICSCYIIWFVHLYLPYMMQHLRPNRVRGTSTS